MSKDTPPFFPDQKGATMRMAIVLVEMGIVRAENAAKLANDHPTTPRALAAPDWTA
jgi:hypothetical protein